jgi:MSHA biogenesis protein MshN
VSLINQMLKDLDKRTAERAVDGAMPTAVRSAGSRDHRCRLLWYAAALLLVAGGALWWVWPAGPTVQASRQEPASAVAPPTEPVSAMLAEKPVPDESDPVTIALQQIRLRETDDRLQLEAVFSRTPDYRLLRTGQGLRLVLELTEAHLTGFLPAPPKGSFLKRVHAESFDGGLRLVLDVQRPCRYEELALLPAAAGPGRILRFTVLPEPETPEKQVETAVPTQVAAVAPAPKQDTPATAEPPAPVAPAVAPGVAESVAPNAMTATDGGGGAMVRRPRPLSAHEQAERACQKARNALREKRWQDGEAALRAALAVEPGHIQARELLARLLLSRGRGAEAANLYAAGMQERGDYLPFRLNCARLLAEEEAWDRALAVLQQEPRPTPAAAPDLYALLAAVQQRRGAFDAAARAYRAALAVRPEQGVWWMGLGIALEGARQPDPARAAYRRALEHGRLSDTLQRYVRQRLAALAQAESPGQVAIQDAARGES